MEATNGGVSSEGGTRSKPLNEVLFPTRARGNDISLGVGLKPKLNCAVLLGFII